MKNHLKLVFFSLLLFTMIISQAQNSLVENKIIANLLSNNETKITLPALGLGGRNSYFGSSVSIDGTTAAVGASGTAGSGVVYILKHDGTNWSKTVTLIASDGIDGDYFGNSVSLSGNRLIVGSSRNSESARDSGAAYIFDFDGTHWNETTKLFGSGFVNDWFGYSVDLDGDKAIVGAYQRNNNTGMAYIFELDAGVWTRTADIIASDGDEDDDFGVSVSIAQDIALVGARRDDNTGGADAGSAYVFTKSGGVWAQTSIINPAINIANIRFGSDVSLSGNGTRALIGASGYSSFKGAAYVFSWDGLNWNELPIITPDELQSNGDAFGGSVDFDSSGDLLIVGQNGDDDNGSSSGAAFIFELDSGQFQQTQKITANDGSESDKFGISVSLSGANSLIGASGDDTTGEKSGSAYIYEHDKTWIQAFKYAPLKGVTNSAFGYALDIDGNRAVIGAVFEEGSKGAAYIYDFDGTSWNLTARLTPSISNEFDSFGESVSLSGDTVLIGAPYNSENADFAGMAYIFKLVDGTWAEIQEISPLNAAEDDEFGTEVSLYNDRAFINLPGPNGSVIVFDYDGTNWVETTELVPDIVVPNNYFGTAIQLIDNKAIIGAIGSVYIFEYINNVWTQTNQLIPSDIQASDGFGVSVAIDNLGLRAIITAISSENNGISDTGSVYVYDLIDDVWTQGQELIANNASEGKFFGNSISVEGDTIVVGSYKNTTNGKDSGSAYLFKLENEIWSQTSEFNASDGKAYDNYGLSVGISNGVVMVGSPLNDGVGDTAGAVYVNNVNPLYSIGGTLTGLSNGNTITIQYNSANDLTLNTNEDFVFSTPLLDSFNYDVSVLTLPDSPPQTCLITGGNNVEDDGSGTITSVNVTNIIIHCDTIPTIVNDTYTILEDGALNANDVDGSNGDSNDDGVLANDSDAEPDSLFVYDPDEYFTQGVSGLLSFNLTGDGTFTYIPSENDFGQMTLDYQVYDGVNIVPATITIDVLPVNDAPSFDFLGDINATDLVSEGNTHLDIPNFTSNLSLANTTHEQAQDYIGYTITVMADDDNVLSNTDFTWPNELNLDFTLNSGTALLFITLQDNGGTDNGGIDSFSRSFSVTYTAPDVDTDTIFSNSFEQ